MTRARTDQGLRTLFLRGNVTGEFLDSALREGVTTVGASPANDLVLPLSGVSRRHAELIWRDGNLAIRDLGSKNGTFVNGRPVRDCEIKAGDVVAFGPHELVIVEGARTDGEIAIDLPAVGPVRCEVESSHRASTTDNGLKDMVPARWLGVTARVFELLIENSESDLSPALEVLVSALAADGATILSLKDRREPVIVGVAGRLDPSFELATFSTSLREQLIASNCQNVTVWLEDQPGPVVGTTRHVCWNSTIKRTEDGESMVLVVLGDFPGRSCVGALLAAVLRAITLSRYSSPHQNEVPPTDPQEGCRLKARFRRAVRTGICDLSFPEGHVVGTSIGMESVYSEIRQLAKGSIPILISGETGTGKEHVARILHTSSHRKDEPFNAVNCAAIPAELLEAELFGIEKGVATGVDRREGKLVQAGRGTVLLDEIGDMSLPLQAKLLRVLQEREVHPVGARRPFPFEARILAATNMDLFGLMENGRFRRDLYYRLAGYTLMLPPLRERRDDIPGLVTHFLARFAHELGKAPRGVTVGALNALSSPPWPGNIRELENVVRRLVYLCPDGQSVTSRLVESTIGLTGSIQPTQTGSPSVSSSLGSQVAHLEETLIREAMERAKGNRTKAARMLGLSRYGLSLKLKRMEQLNTDSITLSDIQGRT